MYDVIHAWFSSLASTTVHRYENDTGIFYLLYILVANIPVYTQKTIDAPHLNGGRPHLPSLHHWYSNQLWYLYYLDPYKFLEDRSGCNKDFRNNCPRWTTCIYPMSRCSRFQGFLNNPKHLRSIQTTTTTTFGLFCRGCSRTFFAKQRTDKL